MGESKQRTGVRVAVAVGIALAAAVVIWIAAPYNDHLLRNTHISDGYLPLAAVFFVLLLVLGVNPLLRWLRPKLALNRLQLAIIFGVLLVASVIPGNGLMRRLPYTIVAVPNKVQLDRVQAEEHQKMGLAEKQPWLFPDKLGYGEPIPNSESFITDLRTGDSIPWSAWAGPAVGWGTLILFGWLMMLGLAQIVLPQWRDRERLAFPLLSVQNALLAEPEKGRLLPPLLRSGGFWVAAGVVVVIRSLEGLNTYFPESVPMVPLRWNIEPLFTEEPWNFAPWYLQTGSLYVILAALAYFTPSRISFSIWFFNIIYAAYWLIGNAYFPPYRHETVREHRLGALIALSVGIFWLSRRRWREVFASFFRRRKEDLNATGNRVAGGMFAVGVFGIFAWLLWIGVQPGFAVIFTVFAVMVSVVISRVIAESGMPYIKIRSELMRVVRLFDANVIAPISLYFGVVMGILFTTTSQVSAAAMGTHALALHEDAGGRKRWPMALLLVGVLALGFVIGGAAHLQLNYYNVSSLDGEEQPINSPEGYMWIGDAFWGVGDLRSGSVENPTYSRHGHLAFGTILAGALLVLCLIDPRWPLHPIGMLMVGSIMGGILWPSVFVGWLLRKLVIKYGGVRMYRKGQTFFLGLIMGELLATLMWTLVPIVLVAMNLPYKRPPVFMPTRTA